jgi:hypothetical protein
VFCLIVVPLTPDKTIFAVQLNNNNNKRLFRQSVSQSGGASIVQNDGATMSEIIAKDSL